MTLIKYRYIIMAETTNSHESEEISSRYHKYFEIFWTFIAIYLLLALISVLGNGLVIYAACRHRNLGPLRYFDGVVKSLAFADLLYGLVGMPITVIKYYMGEFYINILYHLMHWSFAHCI